MCGWSLGLLPVPLFQEVFFFHTRKVSNRQIYRRIGEDKKVPCGNPQGTFLTMLDVKII